MQVQFAEFAAWLHQDKGEHGHAQYWTDRALEWSHIAGDAGLTTSVLARKSQLAGDMQDALTAVQVAEAAAAIAPQGTRLAAVAATYAAHGHALAHDATASARSYDQAHKMLEAGDSGSVSAWGAWLDESYIEVQRAHSLAVLGDFASSSQGYERAIVELPDGYPRDRGVYLARAALAHAGQQDFGLAAGLGMQALAIHRTTRSGRIASGLGQLNNVLAAIDADEVQEFQDVYRTLN